MDRLSPEQQQWIESSSGTVKTPPVKLRSSLGSALSYGLMLFKDVHHLICDARHLGSLGGRLQSFKRLTHLELIDYTIPEEMGVFSAFKDTLSSITLEWCIMSKSSLVSLIEYFPKLQSLHIKALQAYDESEEPTHQISRTLEKLSVSGQEIRKHLIVRLSEDLSGLGLQVNELTLQWIRPEEDLDGGWTLYTDAVIGAFAASVKSLRMIPITNIFNVKVPDLSSCKQLQSFEFGPENSFDSRRAPLDDNGINCISTIQSETIQKIVIDRPRLMLSRSFNEDAWKKLDDVLVKLRPAERLEVEFRGFEYCNYDRLIYQSGREAHYLPGFVEKKAGLMTIWDSQNKLFYSSDHGWNQPEISGTKGLGGLKKRVLKRMRHWR